MTDDLEFNSADLASLEKALCERSLSAFIQRAWPVLEPGRRLVWGWVLDTICDHLEAVSRGEVRRLMINVPPGCMKSLTVRVFWPLWEWLHNPSYRFVGASYAESLALRDNRRSRLVFESEWFHTLWGHYLNMSSDQHAKGRFENNFRGWMQATSVKGMSTGERGDRFIIDDPHNVKQAESDAERDGTLQWFSEVVPSRLNDLGKSAIVVIMQRVHQNDVSGYIMEHDLGYTSLVLPMEYEPERSYTNGIGFRDPRSVEGDLLWPDRFAREDVEALKKQFRAWGGTYAEAGQLQQRPAPREGGMFKVDGFEFADYVPSEVVSSIRSWDKAGTQGGGAYTAGVLMHKMKDGRYCVEDVQRAQLSMASREKMMRETAEKDAQSDHGAPQIWIEAEPGSGGKDSAKFTVQNLAGYDVRVDKVSGSGSKAMRAEPFAAQVEVGNIVLVRGPWNNEYIAELRNFPAGTYKDQVDASSMAFNKLAMKNRQQPVLTVVRDTKDNWADALNG